MAIEAYGTDEFAEWFGGLGVAEKRAVARYVDTLELAGLSLGFPYSSALKDTKYPLRELRVKAGGHAIRVIYIFDPRRNAVLLIGGDKTGKHRFYETMIPKAEAIWQQYLDEQGAGLHDEED
jgi:hypothetical protein